MGMRRKEVAHASELCIFGHGNHHLDEFLSQPSTSQTRTPKAEWTLSKTSFSLDGKVLIVYVHGVFHTPLCDWRVWEYIRIIEQIYMGAALSLII